MQKATLVLLLVMVIGSLSQAFEARDQQRIDNAISTLAVTFSPTLLTQLPTYSSQELSDKKKLVLAAQEDIAYFVATDGAVRTVKFNGAMEAVRELTGNNQAQDMDLAQAVLSEIQ